MLTLRIFSFIACSAIEEIHYCWNRNRWQKADWSVL